MTKSLQGMLLLGLILSGCCMLSFYQTSNAAPHAPPPFANAVEQRFDTIGELREIRALMKEQNALMREQMALLRSGEVKVVVVAAEKTAEQ